MGDANTVNVEKESLKRKFEETRLANEAARKALEDAQRKELDNKRKKQKTEFRERLVASMKVVFSEDRFNAVREAGIDLGFATDALPGSLSGIAFVFSKGETSLRIKYFFYDEDNGADASLSIEVKTESETFYLTHLSANENDKWGAAAEKFGMPDCLLESARITEFCMALMAQFDTRDEFERYVDSLDVIERDGATFYAGHGGYMPVVFKPEFRKDSGLYLGVSC
jgi:hypothetical protein